MARPNGAKCEVNASLVCVIKINALKGHNKFHSNSRPAQCSGLLEFAPSLGRDTLYEHTQLDALRSHIAPLLQGAFFLGSLLRSWEIYYELCSINITRLRRCLVIELSPVGPFL